MPAICLGTTRAANALARVSGPHDDLLSIDLELPRRCRDYEGCHEAHLMAHVSVAALIPDLAATAIARCLDDIDVGDYGGAGHASAGALHVGVVSPIGARPCDVGLQNAQFVVAFTSDYPALSTGSGYENHFCLYADGVEALRALGALLGALRGSRPRLVHSRLAA